VPLYCHFRISGFPPYLQDFRRAKPATFAISLGRAHKKAIETGGHPVRSLRYRAVFSKKGSFLAEFPAGCSGPTRHSPAKGPRCTHTEAPVFCFRQPCRFRSLMPGRLAKNSIGFSAHPCPVIRQTNMQDRLCELPRTANRHFKHREHMHSVRIGSRVCLMAWTVRCIPLQMHELRTFPVPDHHKVLQNRIFAWCGVGACRARYCSLSLAQAPGPSHGGIGRVGSTRVSQLKLRGKAPEPVQNPLIQIMMEACNHAKCGSLFQSGCQGIRAVVVDHVTGAFSRRARRQQTCNHASKQAAHQKNFHSASKLCRL
jgi:hypothetical protein